MSAMWGANFGGGMWNAWDREIQDYNKRRLQRKEEARKKQEAIAEEQRLYDLQKQRRLDEELENNARAEQRALALYEATNGDSGRIAGNAAFAALNSGMLGGMVPGVNGMQLLTPSGNPVQDIMTEALRRSNLSPDLSVGNIMNLDKQIQVNDALKRQEENDAKNKLLRDTNQLKYDISKKDLENYDSNLKIKQDEIKSRIAANEALRNERQAGANRNNAYAAAIKNGSYSSRGNNGTTASAVNIDSLDDTEKQLYSEYLSLSKQIENEKARLPFMEKAKNEAEKNGSDGYITASKQYMNRSKNIDNLMLQLYQKEQELLRYRTSKNAQKDAKSNKSIVPTKREKSIRDSVQKINDVMQGINPALKNIDKNSIKSEFLGRIKKGDKFNNDDWLEAVKWFPDDKKLLKQIRNNIA